MSEPLYIAPYFKVGDLVIVRPDDVVNPSAGTFRITREPIKGKPPVYLAESVTDPSSRISAQPFMLAYAPCCENNEGEPMKGTDHTHDCPEYDGAPDHQWQVTTPADVYLTEEN